MSDKFYIRYNLHKSGVGRDVPWVTPDIFEMSQAEVEEYIRECDNIQQDKADRIKVILKSETDYLSGKEVLFIGDSNTSDRLSYRTIVTKAAALNARDGSVSGATTSTLLIGINDTLSGFNGEMVSIMLGANDSLCFGMDKREPFVSIEENERNLSLIVKWAKMSGATVLLVEIPPVEDASFVERYGATRSHDNEIVWRYNKVLKKIAKKENVAVLETTWLSENKAFFEGDGVHISSEGQERLAEKWLKKAAEIIK